MNNIEENNSIPLYLAGESEFFYEANFHPNTKFISPIISKNEIEEKYYGIVNSKRARKVFPKEYLDNEAQRIDNIELVFAERVEASASAATKHKYSYNYIGYENGDSRYSYVERGFDTNTTKGTGIEYGNHKLNLLTNNETVSTLGLSKEEPSKFARKSFRLFRANSNYAISNARDNAEKKSQSQVHTVGRSKDPYESVSTSSSGYINEAEFFPVYIVTTHKNKEYYYSFFSGMNDNYAIDGDTKPNLIKSKLFDAWTKIREAIFLMSAFCALFLLAWKYLIPEFVSFMEYAWRTIPQDKIITKIFDCVIISILLLVLLIEILTMIIYPIYCIAKYNSKKFDYPYNFTLRNNKSSNVLLQMVKIEIEVIISFLKCILVMAIAFALIKLWLAFVGMFVE